MDSYQILRYTVKLLQLKVSLFNLSVCRWIFNQFSLLNKCDWSFIYSLTIVLLHWSTALCLLFCLLLCEDVFSTSICNTHTHTHTHPFNGSLSRTTQVSRYQKGKTSLDFTEQETVSGSGISWAICKSAPHSRQTTTPAPHHSVFYRLDALPAAQPTASKHWRQICMSICKWC